MRAGDRIKGSAGIMMGGSVVPSGDHEFVYDYQLIRKDGRIREKRIAHPREWAENRPAIRDTRKRGGFISTAPCSGRSGFSAGTRNPVSSTGSSTKRSWTAGRSTMVEVKPKSGAAGGSVYGKAWLDKATGAVLKMEIEVESFSGYERIAAEYTSQGFRPSVSFEIAYGFENGGLFLSEPHPPQGIRLWSPGFRIDHRLRPV